MKGQIRPVVRIIKELMFNALGQTGIFTEEALYGMAIMIAVMNVKYLEIEINNIVC